MIALLKIANRRSCHSPFSEGNGNLNLCRSRPVLRSSTAEDGGHEALIKKVWQAASSGDATSVSRSRSVPLAIGYRLWAINLFPGPATPMFQPHLPSRAVKPCQALSGPVKQFSRKKYYEKLSDNPSASVPSVLCVSFVPFQCRSLVQDKPATHFSP